MDRRNNEESVNSLLLKVVISRSAITQFYFIFTAESFKSCASNVNPTRLATRLHVICNCDVVTENVVLPANI